MHNNEISRTAFKVLNALRCLHQQPLERWNGTGGPTVWTRMSPDLTPSDFFSEDTLRRMSTPPPKRPKISMNSKFAFEMLVNQLTCKYCPMFGRRLIKVVSCVEPPNVSTMK